ncbi:LysR family transcriptional regulator (plasmid) [Kozakia baliensis]|uniref:LysR family transcriptional regulator n=1 Tax=Kozakia baliensis TaxID=153496 RepID=UPI00345C5173
MDLLALADFNLVARHEGFGRAARATNRPKATLSRRVAELEEALDLRLFERGARTLKLTQEGRALFARTGPLLVDLEESAAAIASGGGKPRGRLRISVPLLFAQTAMGRIAANFAQRYPDMRLEVTTEDRPVDMIEEGFDLVIRVNPDPDDSLVGRAFLHDRLVVVASPDLAQPESDRATPVVVRSMSDRTPWRIRKAEAAVIAIEPILGLASLVMVRDAVRAGVGAGCLPISLVSHDLARGTLVQWGEVDAPDIALWALYPTRRLLSARVSAFLDFLKKTFPLGTPDELAAFIGRG